MPRRETQPSPYFRINKYDRLEYLPFRKHELPKLVPVDDGDGGDLRGTLAGTRIQARTVYRLAWPGETTDRVSIPIETVRSWPSMATLKNKSPLFLDTLLATGELPENLPPSIAYHLGVNYTHYETPCGRSHNHTVSFAVAGLPAKRVQQVLDAVFLPDQETLTAAAYLKWLAETHWEHPLLDKFETAIRDELCGIAVKATLLYFRLLGDFQYDRKQQFYSRKEDKHWWGNLAAYLFWVGRTGGGLYADHAGFPVPRSHNRVERFEKELPDVAAQLKLWQVGVAEVPGGAQARKDFIAKGKTEFLKEAAKEYLKHKIAQGMLGKQSQVVVYEGADPDMAREITAILREAGMKFGTESSCEMGGVPKHTIICDLSFMPTL